MSDAPDRAASNTGLARWIRGPQDFFGGLALAAIAVFSLWASSDLGGTHGFSFGAGTAPRLFSGLLLILGLAIVGVGIVREGSHMSAFSWRGPLFVTLSLLSFAVTIRPLGLIASAFLSFMISALGTPETRWKETTIVGLVLTAACSLLFPYALGLPFELLPPVLTR